MSFLNGLYQSTDIQLSGVDSVNTTYGDSLFYLTSSLGENFIIYIDGTSVFVLNSSTGVLTISAPINITSTFSVNGYQTFFSFLSGSASNNLNTGSAPFPSLTTATNNTAYGVEAMNLVTTGSSNTAVGYRALKSLTTGGSNTAFGNFSLQNVTTGILNLGFGYLAGDIMVSSIVATCIGYSAGNGGFQGNYVNLFGNQSYIASAGLEYSTCLGTGSFIDANYQVALGRSLDTIIIRGNVGLANTDSTNKVASTSFTQSAINRLLYKDSLNNFGFNTTQYNTPPAGGGNFAIGNNCLQNASGGYNTAIGNVSLRDCTTGTQNFCLGSLNMYALTTGSFNISVGVFCLANTNGSANIGMGYLTGQSSVGDYNVYIGHFCCNGGGADGYNVGIGYNAFQNLNGGQNNTACGTSAGNGITTGTLNSCFGAGSSISPGTLTYATAIGAQAQATTSNSVYLGRSSDMVYAVGGLTIPSPKTLTYNGSTLSGSIVDTGTANQSITARKDFEGFDNTIPN
jgi:hypothetical protein